jgi:hypothetical protein
MFTSSFKKAGKNAKAVAISRGLPKGYTGIQFLSLAPTPAMLKLKDINEFYQAYKTEILDKLEPALIYERLSDAILLCWEDFNVCCHRRMVAEWLEGALGVTIPELGHERHESLYWRDMPLKPPSTRWKKKSDKAAPSLFAA